MDFEPLEAIHRWRAAALGATFMMVVISVAFVLQARVSEDRLRAQIETGAEAYGALLLAGSVEEALERTWPGLIEAAGSWARAGEFLRLQRQVLTRGDWSPPLRTRPLERIQDTGGVLVAFVPFQRGTWDEWRYLAAPHRGYIVALSQDGGERWTFFLALQMSRERLASLVPGWPEVKPSVPALLEPVEQQERFGPPLPVWE